MITHVIVELDAPIEEKYWEDDDVWSNEYCGIGKPLIRCKDCKFFSARSEYGHGLCDVHCNGVGECEVVNENDYCSKAEVNEE